jgi:serine palmitoyltransferase
VPLVNHITGGYIAGSKETIDRLRIKSHSMCYAEAMTPPVVTQIVASMASIMGVSPPLTAASNSPVHKPTLSLHASSSDTDLPALTMAYEPGPPVYGPAPASYLPNWLHLPPALLNGTEGRERLRRLAFNSRYLSSGLRKLGFIISGHRDSPIVPLFLFHPGKMPIFSRMMLERVGKDRTPVVVVVVAYP